MTPVLHRVRRVSRENADTVSFDVVADDPLQAAAAVVPRPGQFNMLYAFEVGEIPLSISGCDEGPAVRHTVRAVGAVSSALCALEDGDPVGVRGPFGRGWPLDALADREVLLVAGGLGLAPLRPVVLAAALPGWRGRRISVAIGVHQPDDLLYRGEIAEWRRSGLEVTLTADIAAAGWAGHHGLVTDVIADLVSDPTDTVAFVCGPEGMMEHAAARLMANSVAPDDIHLSVERNMHCGIGHCGRCQLGGLVTCLDGTIFDWATAGPLLEVPQL